MFLNLIYYGQRRLCESRDRAECQKYVEGLKPGEYGLGYSLSENTNWISLWPDTNIFHERIDFIIAFKLYTAFVK
jgi:hypothetical protein